MFTELFMLLLLYRIMNNPNLLICDWTFLLSASEQSCKTHHCGNLQCIFKFHFNVLHFKGRNKSQNVCRVNVTLCRRSQRSSCTNIFEQKKEKEQYSQKSQVKKKHNIALYSPNATFILILEIKQTVIPKQNLSAFMLCAYEGIAEEIWAHTSFQLYKVNSFCFLNIVWGLAFLFSSLTLNICWSDYLTAGTCEWTYEECEVFNLNVSRSNPPKRLSWQWWCDCILSLLKEAGSFWPSVTLKRDASVWAVLKPSFSFIYLIYSLQKQSSFIWNWWVKMWQFRNVQKT